MAAIFSEAICCRSIQLFTLNNHLLIRSGGIRFSSHQIDHEAMSIHLLCIIGLIPAWGISNRDWDSASDSIRMAHSCRSSLGQVISTNQSAYLLACPPVRTRSANSSSPEWQTLHQPVVWWSFNPDKVHQYQVFRPLGVDLTSFWLCSGKDSPLSQERRLEK